MQELFEHYFEADGFHIKYARCAPSVRGEEFHNYHEIVFFLGGDARFISKNIQRDLAPGNVIFIPRNEFHRFSIKGSDYTRCILGFREQAEMQPLLSSLLGEPMLIEAPDTAMKVILDGLTDTARREMPKQEKLLYLYAAVIHLLFELKKEGKEHSVQSFGASSVVRDALLLIDQSYTTPITVESLARELRVSSSLLSHKFKDEMNISLYKYVIKKRLAAARQAIESGVLVTDAAIQSGFSDYTCFLRAYKKEYGQLPSQKST